MLTIQGAKVHISLLNYKHFWKDNVRSISDEVNQHSGYDIRILLSVLTLLSKERQRLIYVDRTQQHHDETQQHHECR